MPPFETLKSVPDQLELFIVFSVASVPKPEISVFFNPRDDVAMKFKALPFEKAMVDDAPIAVTPVPPLFTGTELLYEVVIAVEPVPVTSPERVIV